MKRGHLRLRNMGRSGLSVNLVTVECGDGNQWATDQHGRLVTQERPPFDTFKQVSKGCAPQRTLPRCEHGVVYVFSRNCLVN